ncbi:alpha/beta fold hydrolase [Enterococcus sp. LJL99]
MKKEIITFEEEKRGVFFDEKSDERPLLVYIHGGPLYPELFLIERYYPALNKYFQCIFPETRGSGLSVNSTKKQLSVENLVEDIIEWVEYFLEKWNKNTCVIMGHSFGTITASLAVKKDQNFFLPISVLVKLIRCMSIKKLFMNL